jgi:hypothetical protein
MIFSFTDVHKLNYNGALNAQLCSLTRFLNASLGYTIKMRVNICNSNAIHNQSCCQLDQRHCTCLHNNNDKHFFACFHPQSGVKVMSALIN